MTCTHKIALRRPTVPPNRFGRRLRNSSPSMADRKRARPDELIAALARAGEISQHELFKHDTKGWHDEQNRWYRLWVDDADAALPAAGEPGSEESKARRRALAERFRRDRWRISAMDLAGCEPRFRSRAQLRDL